MEFGGAVGFLWASCEPGKTRVRNRSLEPFALPVQAYESEVRFRSGKHRPEGSTRIRIQRGCKSVLVDFGMWARGSWSPVI